MAHRPSPPAEPDSVRTSSIRSGGTPTLVNEWAPLIAVLAIAVTVRWLFLYGLIGSDDTWYTDAATDLARGLPPQRVDHFTVRGAFMMWLALWMRAGLAASQLVPTQLIAAALQAGALFWIARRLTNVRSAIYATVLWILFPVELIYGGILVPDQLGLGLTLVALGLALWSSGDPKSPRFGAAMAAGVFIGLAYSSKEPLVVALPAILLWGVLRPRSDRPSWTWFAAISAGAFCVFLVEHAFFAAWTGDWLYKYHALSESYGSAGSHLYPVTARRLAYYIVDVLAAPRVAGFFGVLLVLGGALGFAHVRHRSLVACWTLAFFGFLQFGTTDPFNYLLLPMQPRYVGPIVVMLFVPLGAAIVHLQQRSAIARIAVIAVLTATVTHGVVVAHQRLHRGLYFSDVPDTAAFVLAQQRADREIPELDVLVPNGYLRRLPVDLRDSTSSWETGDLQIVSQAVDHRFDCAIVVPVRNATPELREALAGRGFRESAIRRPVVPMDDLFRRVPLGLVRSISRERTVGYYYVRAPTSALVRDSNGCVT